MNSIYFFLFQGGFSFNTSNMLKVYGGSLAFASNLLYQFVIETDYLNTTYSQLIRIQIDSTQTIPVATAQ